MERMIRRIPVVTLLAFVLLGISHRVDAQTCNGFGSIHTGPWQLSAGGAWTDTSDRFLTYLQHAWGNAIAGAGYSVTSIDKVDPKSTMVFGGAGYEFPLESQGRATLCVGGELGYVRGPDIAPLQLRSIASQASARIGFAVVKTAAFDLIPTLALSAVRNDLTATVGTVEQKQTQTSNIADIGVGFVFGGRVAIVPTIHRQLRQADGPNSFSLFLALTLGKS